MKIVWDKTYLKISAYIVLTATIIYILYGLISHLGFILNSIWMVVGVILSVLSPLIIALVIAYLLHPLVTWIDASLATNLRHLPWHTTNNDKYQHLRRTVSVLITYLLFVSVIVLLIYSLYIMISGSLPKHLNLNSMIISIVNYTNTYNDLFNRLISTLQTSGLSDNFKNQLLALVQVTQNFIARSIAGLFASLQKFGSNLFDIVLGLVIAFYLLKDIEYFGNLYHQSTGLLFNRQHNEKLSAFMADINKVVSNFIRGQLLVALIVGVTSSIALYLVGLEYAVLVGMTAGICNVIPYFGPIVGSILAVTVALISGTPLKAVFAVLALLVVQQLDGTFISPKIVGSSVGLHPVVVIMAIVIGGSFLGILGMLLAVPTAAIIKLLLNQWLVSDQEREAS